MEKQVNIKAEKSIVDKFDIWCLKNDTKRPQALINYMIEKGSE